MSRAKLAGVRRLRVAAARVSEIALSRVAKVNPAPILVLGNQKTGTTAIAALLARLVGASVTLDIRGIQEPVRTKLHTREISFENFVLKNKLDFSRDIVKDPNLVYLYEDVVRYFPASRIVFVNRDPRSNLRSVLNRLSLPGNRPQLEEAQLEHIPRGWRGHLDGRWLGLEGENYIEMMAARWNLAADTYLRNADKMVLIRYEDFCRDKIVKIDWLAKRLELESVNDISDRVNYQYQPRGNRDISWLDFFGADNLARIECICRDRMERFGYQPSQFG